MSEQSSDIPSNVQKFIELFIDSVEKLEILLMLHANPEQSWTATEIATHLRSSPQSVLRRLDELNAHRLVLRHVEPESDRFQFNRACGDWEADVKDLQTLAKLKRRTIITLIFSKPNEKLRVFADAFKLRKDPS